MKKTTITFIGWLLFALFLPGFWSMYLIPEVLPDYFYKLIIVCAISGLLLVWVGQIVGDVDKNGSVILKQQYNLVRNNYSASRFLVTCIACSLSGVLIGIVCVLVLWFLGSNYSSVEVPPTENIDLGNNTALVIKQRVRPEGFVALGILLVGCAAAFFAPLFTTFIVVESLMPGLKIPTDWKHTHRRPIGVLLVLISYVSAVIAIILLLSIIF